MSSHNLARSPRRASFLSGGKMFLLLLLNLALPQPDTLHVYRQPEVVVSATRTPINNVDAPSRVTRINVIEMHNAGFNDAKSMLSLVDGIFLKDYGPAQLGTISLRGTAAEQTLFLFDGVSLNNIQTGLVDLFLVPTNNLSSIEISQGGSSALYGANAVGGVVDLESKTPSDNTARLDMGGGSYGNQMIGAEVSEGIGPAKFDFMVQRQRGVNDFDFSFDAGTHDIPMKLTGADYLEDVQSLKIVLPSSNSLTSLLIQNVSANRGTPGAVYDSGFVGTAREIDGNTIGILQNTGRLGVFNYRASAGIIYSFLKYIDPAYATNDYFKTLSLQPAAQLSYSSEQFSGATGIDAEFDRGQSDEMAAINNRNRIGIFGSGEYDLRKNADLATRLFGALRFDDYSAFGSSLNPKAGINIKPLARFPLHLRANVGTSFRVPTFDELYFYNPYYYEFGNENLKPERSTDYDLGAAADFGGNQNLLYANLGLDYYHIDTRDGIVWQQVTNTSWQPENLQKIVSRGIEVSFHLHYGSLFSLKGNYFFGKSQDISNPSDPTTYNKQLIYLPQEQSALFMEVTPGIFAFTAAIQYVGERFYTVNDTASLSPYAVTYVSAAARINAGSFALLPRISVNDLFNRKYEVIREYPVPARMYQVGLSIQFNQGK